MFRFYLLTFLPVSLQIKRAVQKRNSGFVPGFEVHVTAKSDVNHCVNI